MSAKKRAMIRLDRDEYDQLKKLEKLHLQDKSNVSWHQAEVAAGYIKENVSGMLQRQDNYKRLVKSLNREINQVEQNSQQALIQQENQFLNYLTSLETEMGYRTDDLLQQQNEIYTNVIDDLQANHQDDLQEDYQSKQDIAVALIEDVDRYYEWIRENYDWNFFKPDTLIKFEREMDQATENYYQGLLEASIVQNQQVMREMQESRLEVEQKQAEWSFLRGIIDEKIQQYLASIEENQYAQPVDLKMNVIEGIPSLDVNEWSQGILEKILDSLQDMQERIQEENCLVSTDEMRAWLDQVDSQMNENIASTIMLARYNALDAQIRRNLASVVTEVMEENGFQVVEHNADTSGIHEPFFVLMQDDHGGEISIDITPEQGYINNIAIEMSDKNPVMEYELEERRREVVNELGRRGVAVERLDNKSEIPVGINSQYERYDNDSFDDNLLKKRIHQRRKK